MKEMDEPDTPPVFAFSDETNSALIRKINAAHDAGDLSEAAWLELERRILYRLDRIEKHLGLTQRT